MCRTLRALLVWQMPSTFAAKSLCPVPQAPAVRKLLQVAAVFEVLALWAQLRVARMLIPPVS